MSPLRSLIVFAGVLFPSTYAYVDFGSLTLPIEPLFEPTPRPEQLPEDIDLRYEILPSMITAVAPSVTLVGNGTHQTMYSLHYHHYFSKTRQGKGMFDKRGVFSGDPPVATCNPCGTDGVYTPTAPSLTSNSVPCTTHTYHGVFDFPPSSTALACYNSNYTGALQPSTSAYAGLPCCFTIPASCRLNNTLFANSTTSFRATSGVFRPTSTSLSTTSRISTTSTISRFSLSTPTSTSGSSSRSQSLGPILNSGSTPRSTSISARISGSSTQSQSPSQSLSQSQGPILNSGTTSISTSTSTSVRTTVTVISGTTTVLTITTSAMTTNAVVSSSTAVSSNPYTSPSTSLIISTTSYSIIVISSTTITLTPSSTTTSAAGGVSVQPTLTIITGPTTSFASTSATVSVITSTNSNTIVGCGEASGSGIIIGTGTVYLAGTSVTASGSVSGYASKVSGCGTIVATTGSFSGSAEITGCGFGYGTGTMTGEGTVWPKWGGGLFSVVSSGTVSGAGSFAGCGTITGSGYFSATLGSPVLVTITPTPRPTKTVSVYISYCPDSTSDANRLLGLVSSNATSPANLLLNGTSPLGYTSPYAPSNSSSDPPSGLSTSSDHVELPNPLCQICPNSVGICCPPTVSCDVSDGKCPLFALENSGQTINGYLIAQVMNSTAPVAGRKKVRALARKDSHELVGEKRHVDKHRKAHHKHF